jgi:hypothetical protein
MHRTPSSDRRQALQKAARAPVARQEARRLQGQAEKALADAQALKLQARLEDLTVWEMKEVKQTRKGSKTYSYWMASWREGGRTRNVHLGSCRKMNVTEARRKAREIKAEALGYNETGDRSHIPNFGIPDLVFLSLLI